MAVNINEKQLEQLNHTKFLGVHIDEELSWKFHINHVSKKISKMTGIMGKARHYLSLTV